MQPIGLDSGYDKYFLQDLIQRHEGRDTTDRTLDLHVQHGTCELLEDHTLTCKDRSFGSATYAYMLDEDHVTVNTRIHGQLSLELVRDSKGIYQLDLTVTNKLLSWERVLKIRKEFGPKIDPSQQSLTPWSPGCLFTPPQNPK
jgi:hypothetical protein